MAPSPSSNIWFLRNTPVFKEQSESLYQSAEMAAQPRSFKRGDLLSPMEESAKFIFLVVEGQIKLRSITAEGKEIILDVVGPGDVFGPLDHVLEASGEMPAPNAATGSAALASEAVALSGGRALRYPIDYFKALVHKRPNVIINLTRILGLRQRRFEIRLTRLLYRSSLGKVAGLLAEMGERYGRREADGIHLDVKLTHKEMASIVGIKRETVSEVLGELEYKGVIAGSRGGLHIVQPDELDRIP